MKAIYSIVVPKRPFVGLARRTMLVVRAPFPGDISRFLAISSSSRICLALKLSTPLSVVFGFRFGGVGLAFLSFLLVLDAL